MVMATGRPQTKRGQPVGLFPAVVPPLKFRVQLLFVEQAQLEQLLVVAQIDCMVVIDIQPVHAFSRGRHMPRLLWRAAEAALESSDVCQIAISIVVHVQKRATVFAPWVAAPIGRPAFIDAFVAWEVEQTRPRAA